MEVKAKTVTYKEVCTGNTNHAEVVKLDFDPEIISYEKILDFFFEIHDPTTLNSQGPDFGTQYRSEIFYLSDRQKEIAENVLKKMNSDFVRTGCNKIFLIKKLLPSRRISSEIFRKKIICL